MLRKRTFWSKRSPEDMTNSWLMQAKLKRPDVTMDEEAFPVLPFSTMIRKPLGKRKYTLRVRPKIGEMNQRYPSLTLGIERILSRLERIAGAP